ncbi:MAG TPA: DUF885 family protein, partial [Sphingomicrobium sp.]
MTQFELSRREAMAGLAASAAIPLLTSANPAFAAQAGGAEAQATALLDSIAENLLNLSPENATSLGIDTGARAGLKHRLGDRSGIGQQRIAQTLRADLARANAVDTAALSHSTRTSVEVVRSAFATALEGFRLPYGDVPVAYNSWRKTPYVVIQNVGAYLDVPRFLDSDHPIGNAADADAYLARLRSYARQLDGELDRMRAARGAGLVPPA